MKNMRANQSGFITMIVGLLIVLVLAIGLVYLRVIKAS